MLASVAVMAGLAGAAVAWWAVGQREQPVAAVVPVPTPSPQSSRRPAGGSGGRAVESAEQTAVVLVATPTLSTPQVATTQGPAPEPTPQERTGAVSNDRIFDLDADLGYATLSLGFIVARPVNPFAEINGIEVSVGSEVEGFRVEKIEADRVVLRDEKGELVLRVP